MEQIKQTKKRGDWFGRFKNGFKNSFKSEWTKRRKVFILVGMFALLAITGYLNFTLNNQSAKPVSQRTYSTANFFTMYHAQRMDDRAASIAVLSSMAALDSGYDAATRANAAAQLSALLANIQFENNTEAAIKAQGYQNVIVMKTGNNINTIVQKNATLEQQAAVQDNIFREIRDQFLANSSFGKFDIEAVKLSFIA